MRVDTASNESCLTKFRPGCDEDRYVPGFGLADELRVAGWVAAYDRD